MNNYKKLSAFPSAIYVCLFFSIALVACGGGGGGSASNSNPPNSTTTIIPLTNAVRNIQLTNGVLLQMVFPVTVNPSIDLTARGNASINIAKTLEKATLSAAPLPRNTSSRFETWKMLAKFMVKNALASSAATADVTAHISYRGDPNVCNSVYQFGPYGVTGMIGTAVSSNSMTIASNDPVQDITNSGEYDICVKTTPPIDGFFTVTDIAVDFEECASSSLDIVGTWSGTFQCDNFGTVDEVNQPITLTISRNPDGSYRYIDDSNATYDGHLCGTQLKFKGGLVGSYNEAGTLRFSSNTTATKTSRWNNIAPGVTGGTCSDTLQKM